MYNVFINIYTHIDISIPALSLILSGLGDEGL